MNPSIIIRYSFFTICLVLGGLYTSCSEENGDQPVVISEIPTLSATDREVVKSANNFSFDLFSEINKQNEDANVFISPFSVSTALSMTLNGANGNTADEIKTTIGLDKLSNQEINESYKLLVNYLLTADSKVAINVANSNWYSDQNSIKEEFKQILLDYYAAEVNPADFGDPATVDLINEWIEGKTNDKIKDMLDVIPADAVMYLINAIYFKADWTYQFDKNETKDAEFYLSDGSSRMVPTMYCEAATVGTSANENYSLIDIPYGNERFSFTVVMSNEETKDINEMASEFSNEILETMIADTLHRTRELYMPKMKVEFKQELKDQLMTMGMPQAFSGSADFSNLFDELTNLSISRIVHQSFLEVNEEGSEAAAVTIVEVSTTSIGPDSPFQLKIDRPFLFFIREKHTNTILFSGKMMDPTL